MTHAIFEIVGTGMMSSYDFIGICECEKERSLEVVGSVVSVCLRWGFAIAIFFSVGFQSLCNYCWWEFKTKPAKAEWRQKTPTMPSYVVLWACDSHEWRTKDFAFTWMNHSLPTETGHSETSTDYCWPDISLLLSSISLHYCPQINICQQMDALPAIWFSWEVMSIVMCQL